MRYFQIRVSEHSCLDWAVRQIAEEVWLKIKDSLQSQEILDYRRIQFQSAIKYVLHQHIQKYPNCGLAAECHEDIEGGPWMDYSDKIYIMSSVGGLESIINQISNEVLEEVAEILTTQEKSKLQSDLSKAFRHELGEYLYFNPSCKKVPFCNLEL